MEKANIILGYISVVLGVLFFIPLLYGAWWSALMGVGLMALGKAMVDDPDCSTSK
jgi:hypothetical protein